MKRTLAVVLACAVLLCTAAFAADTTEVSPLSPMGMCEYEGGLLIADAGQNAILSRSALKEYKIFAGKINPADAYGKPAGGLLDGDALTAQFDSPSDVVPFAGGYAVSDSGNNIIRLVKDGKVTTFAGSGTAGLTDGAGIKAAFSCPMGLAVDSAGTLYVADTNNNCIRTVDKDCNVKIYAGSAAEGYADGALTAARFNSPSGICWYGGALYVADTDNNCIRKIADGQVTTVTGGSSGVYEGSTVLAGGFADGWQDTALFRSPMDVSGDASGLYIADTGNGAVRQLNGDWVKTILDSEVISTVSQPSGVCCMGGDLFSSDKFSSEVLGGDNVSVNEYFGDIKASSWYNDYVAFATGNRLFNGVGAGEFSPEGTMTRAMISAVVGRAAQLPNRDLILSGVKTFSDVPADSYYAEGLAWAADNGIIAGTGENTFTPDKAASRQETITMLYRLAGVLGRDTKAAASIDSFADSASVADWAKPAMQWAAAKGIISGNDQNQLMPDAALTRAQAAKIFSEFIKLR